MISIVNIENKLISKNYIVLTIIWKDKNDYYNEENNLDSAKAHEAIIGEIIIEFGDKDSIYYSNKFSDRVINSKSLDQLQS